MQGGSAVLEAPILLIYPNHLTPVNHLALIGPLLAPEVDWCFLVIWYRICISLCAAAVLAILAWFSSHSCLSFWALHFTSQSLSTYSWENYCMVRRTWLSYDVAASFPWSGPMYGFQSRFHSASSGIWELLHLSSSFLPSLHSNILWNQMQCWQEQQICSGTLLEISIEWLSLEAYTYQIPCITLYGNLKLVSLKDICLCLCPCQMCTNYTPLSNL